MKNSVKRLMDIVISLCALILGFPIYLITAIAIKLDSKGPVFYSQDRVGRNEKNFKFWKFRSMVVNADEILFKNKEMYEKMRSGSHKIADDPRITKVGKFIRRTSIDELPQFWNILKGDMSFVGPRAYRPDEIKIYRDEKREGYELFPKVFSVKPGLTGIWQVSGRSTLTFLQRVQMDADYAENWTVPGDVKIIIQTPIAVIKGEGAY